MTNNKLQDQLMEFWDTYKDKVGLGEFSDELTRFVQTLLTKKDQEHKAALEMIKGELKEKAMAYFLPEMDGLNPKEILPERLGAMSYNHARGDFISILDSHINKLSTE